ncbi:hypothetical protein [Sphingomonas sp. GC_Shp_3]|uniref:hypothetical protein n=1 Tax=Sphingomonas sp. GC_Shp_3 TaxID=2937383 RepID=UPI002269AF53|nr:hypothetical protein [Sphingomonas sp. GC_Shp_3]
MSGQVLSFPSRGNADRGTIHVWGDRVDGFQVSHESASGNSWGEILDFRSGADAITAAHTLNRNQYQGRCEVLVIDAALQDACPGVGLPSLPGDF